jgi:hypothetical protein
VATARVIEPIDILEYRALSLTACVPMVALDQFGLPLRGGVLRSNVLRVMDLKNVSPIELS